jgi:hypothetical protein
MSQFDTNKWFKRQYLTEAGLYESKAAEAAKAMDDAIASVDESLSYKDFALAVATILKNEYGSQNFNPFMKVLHAELGMEESLNEAEEMATYKVEVVLAADEGGPDYSEDIEVEVDSSLKGDELNSAIRNAVYNKGYTRRSIYKINYKK